METSATEAQEENVLRQRRGWAEEVVQVGGSS
jgi:hypothetical protein